MSNNIPFFSLSIDFADFTNRRSTQKVPPIIFESEIAFVGYGNDRNSDFYLVNTAQPNESSDHPSQVIGSRVANALYQNHDWGYFTDVAKQIGLDHDG